MLSPAIRQASYCFAFEDDFVGNWRCIPLCLRRKLDLAGIKLRLTHWLAFDQQQRQVLVDWPDDADALQAMATHIRGLTRTMPQGEVSALAPANAESWQVGDLPQQVARSAAGVQRPITSAQWNALAELERFALCKLARAGGHDHHNLASCLREILG